MAEAPDPRPDEKLIRQRQRSGAKVTALLLGAFVLLVFLVTIAKITVNQ
ncbi:hypothetical protein [Sphingomonas arenae]|nr:hypothetical protein [Sphingomonas arenae]